MLTDEAPTLERARKLRESDMPDIHDTPGQHAGNASVTSDGLAVRVAISYDSPLPGVVFWNMPAAQALAVAEAIKAQAESIVRQYRNEASK